MSFLQAILLGILQGITEFLPVSSSGHLAIFKHILGITKETGLLFDVLLHLGTLCAVRFAFQRDIKQILIELCRIVCDIIANIKLWFYNKKTKEGKRYTKILHNNYRKLIALIFVSTIPTFLIGYALQSVVKSASTTLIGPGIGLFITGVLLLVVDFVPSGKKIPKEADYKSALLIGISQGISVLPGLSRSGATISCSLLCGYNRKFAVKYSFLMSIPAIIGATIYEIVSCDLGKISFTTGLSYFIGAILAGLTGFICIRVLIRFLEKHRLIGFSYYCFIIGLVAIIANFIK